MRVSFHLSASGNLVPRIVHEDLTEKKNNNHHNHLRVSARSTTLIPICYVFCFMIMLVIVMVNIWSYTPSRLQTPPSLKTADTCQASVTVFPDRHQHNTFTITDAIRTFPLFRSGSNISLVPDGIEDRYIQYHAHPMEPSNILQCFFHKDQSQLDTVLTLDPKPNCQGGRYLDFYRAKDGLSFLALDGLGSFLSTYMKMVSLAVLTKTTIIDFDWYNGGISHAQDETLKQRQEFFHFDRFHLNRRHFYQQCRKDTSFSRRNVIDITYLINYALTTNFLGRDPTKEDFDFLPEFRMQLNDLIMEHTLNLTKTIRNDDNGGDEHGDHGNMDEMGYTLVFDAELYYYLNDLQYASRVMGARHEAFHPYRTIMSGQPPGSHYLQQLPWLPALTPSETDGRRALTYQDSTMVPTTSSIFVAVHIRRNDVITYRDGHAYIQQSQVPYMLTDDAFLQIIHSVDQAVPTKLRPRLVYTIYSEGEMSDFQYIANQLEQKHHIRAEFRLNGATTRILKHLIQADILIMSTSSFSYAAASMHRDQIKINADGGQKTMFTRLPNLMDTTLIRHPVEDANMWVMVDHHQEIKLSDVKMTWMLTQDAAKLVAVKMTEKF